ncbi:hypothetical protein, partial [Acinetobacter baumannii]|uniref:hypothetical protein n=1 Tax=Acinetobacter baumannii TaxID=470 RepID=UPI0037D3AC32
IEGRAVGIGDQIGTPLLGSRAAIGAIARTGIGVQFASQIDAEFHTMKLKSLLISITYMEK